jgi:hypothetical protein
MTQFYLQRFHLQWQVRGAVSPKLCLVPVEGQRDAAASLPQGGSYVGGFLHIRPGVQTIFYMHL